MHRHKRYITPQALRYIEACKLHLSTVLHARGMTAADLSRLTQIPEGTLSRWLSLERPEMMPFGAAAVIADALDLTVRDLLAHPDIRRVDDERYQCLGPLLSAPIEHVRALSSMYEVIRRR